MASSTLFDIVSQITRDATVVSDFYTTHGVQQPSFSSDGPPVFPAGAPEEILRARHSLIWAAKQLQMLALGPTESLQWLALTGALDTASLRWIYHFDIAAAVPETGNIDFGDLASRVGVCQTVLTRILRHAMTNNVFVETAPGRVSHTSLSRLLADGSNPIRGVVGHQTEVVFPAMAHMVDAHDRFGTMDDCVTHTSFNEAFRTDMRALDWIASDDIRSARFAESMKGGAKSGQSSVAHTVAGFDWRSLGNGVLVDVGSVFYCKLTPRERFHLRQVGGSAGQASRAICAAAPDLTCIVQDLPSMVAKGKAELDPVLANRISFMEHDFFEPQPVEAPAAFLLRLILHDWPDQDACKILRELASKAGPQTRILINDSIMPSPGAVDSLTDRRIRNIDLMMMTMFNGKERSREAWAELVKMADPNLRITKISRPEGSAMSMIEIARSDAQ